MIKKTDYIKAQIIVKSYEQKLGLYNIDLNGSLPFEEYHKFHEWMQKEGWYEAAYGEYDNFEDPNSCIRLNIKELYLEYKMNN